MASKSSLAVLGLRLAPLAASSAFSAALVFQIFTFDSVQRSRLPASEARRVARGLIHLMSPIIIADYAVAFANPFIQSGRLSPAVRRCYLAAVAFRVLFVALHHTATRIRGTVFNEGVGDDELFEAMRVHVERNRWRFWALTLPTWLVSVAGPVLYAAGR